MARNVQRKLTNNRLLSALSDVNLQFLLIHMISDGPRENVGKFSPTNTPQFDKRNHRFGYTIENDSFR